jgi:long-chain acyl-CoA synthetase
VDFKSMKVCYGGAAPLLVETKQRFEVLTGGRLLDAHGMTETMLAAVVCLVHGAYKEGSIGIPVRDVDVRIVDVDTGKQILAAGEIGEVCISAPQTTVGYWGRLAETAEMIRDGWVHTGDIGHMDEDGYLGEAVKAWVVVRGGQAYRGLETSDAFVVRESLRRL